MWGASEPVPGTSDSARRGVPEPAALSARRQQGIRCRGITRLWLPEPWTGVSSGRPVVGAGGRGDAGSESQAAPCGILSLPLATMSWKESDFESLIFILLTRRMGGKSYLWTLEGQGLTRSKCLGSGTCCCISILIITTFITFTSSEWGLGSQKVTQQVRGQEGARTRDPRLRPGPVPAPQFTSPNTHFTAFQGAGAVADHYRGYWLICLLSPP